MKETITLTKAKKMTPETFIVSFWRPGSEDYCPVTRLAYEMEYDETAQVCASLKARGYLIQVYTLKGVATPQMEQP